MRLCVTIRSLTPVQKDLIRKVGLQRARTNPLTLFMSGLFTLGNQQVYKPIGVPFYHKSKKQLTGK